ncbi:MAG: hypothetical protein PHF79_02325 [Candidatus Pacebacteria bacterium]|nr:hypothetical protein [Candidatus Paceibacterota bacterium]
MYWLKQNWFKFFILLIILLLSAIIAYFFITNINLIRQNESDKNLSEDIKDCSAEQSVIEKYYKSYYDLNKTSTESMSSTNHFNRQTKKCYVEIYNEYTVNDSDTDVTLVDSVTNLFDAYEKKIVLDGLIIGSPSQGKIISEYYTDYSTSTSGLQVASSTFDDLEYFYMNK